MLKLKSALLAAGLVGASLSSHAIVMIPVSQATIDWSSFSYQLFDLDPLDGVAPSLTWEYQGSSTSISGANITFDSDQSSNWSTSLSSTGSTLDASATADTLSVTSSGYQPGFSYGNSQRYGDFSLSAMTLAVFSVDGSASVLNDGDPSTYVYASAQLSVYGLDAVPYSNSYSSLDVWENGSSMSASGRLSASFVNLTAANQSAGMGAYVFAETAAPVPEPHTYGMLLAGLAVMTQVARRRRSR